MNDDGTGKPSGRELRTDWRRLRRTADEKVHAGILDDPEIKATDDEFWESAKVMPAVSKRRAAAGKRSARLTFRPDIHFDPRNDDAIIWGDEGRRHFRLVIRRRLLHQKYGLEKHFDQAGAEAVVKQNRDRFEQLAQSAYETGASELIVG